MLRKRRGYQPSLRVFVPCHGLENTLARGLVRSGRLRPPIFVASALGLFEERFLHPAVLIQRYPPITGHSRACPENPGSGVVGVSECPAHHPTEILGTRPRMTPSIDGAVCGAREE